MGVNQADEFRQEMHSMQLESAQHIQQELAKIQSQAHLSNSATNEWHDM